MRDYLPFVFSLFLYSLYIFLSKDCIHCIAYTSHEEWVPLVEYFVQIIPTTTQYGRSIHKSFLTRNVCVK
jgi:hypothetical protein